jgi:hypothetical protein
VLLTASVEQYLWGSNLFSSTREREAEELVGSPHQYGGLRHVVCGLAAFLSARSFPGNGPSCWLPVVTTFYYVLAIVQLSGCT